MHFVGKLEKPANWTIKRPRYIGSWDRPYYRRILRAWPTQWLDHLYDPGMALKINSIPVYRASLCVNEIIAGRGTTWFNFTPEGDPKLEINFSAHAILELLQKISADPRMYVRGDHKIQVTFTFAKSNRQVMARWLADDDRVLPPDPDERLSWLDHEDIEKWCDECPRNAR